jgi:hypothetical protein
MNNVKEALSWITSLIKKHNIPFQIAGGLATQAYGSTRELHDIDIDIPEKDFETIKSEIAPFITFGPDYFKDECWDLFLMTLNYHGQEIDISGACDARIYNKKDNIWEKIVTGFSKVNFIKVYNLNLPVIRCKELIAYKKILSRPVDLLDIEYLEQNLGSLFLNF